MSFISNRCHQLITVKWEENYIPVSKHTCFVFMADFFKIIIYVVPKRIKRIWEYIELKDRNVKYLKSIPYLFLNLLLLFHDRGFIQRHIYQ